MDEVLRKTYTRNQLIDVIKGIAIFLVVFGHAIQYGSGNYYYQNEFYFDNTVFKMIYSFHMPLFMVISGYLFSKSMNKYTTHELIRSRVKTILLPILLWAFISIIVVILIDGLEHNVTSIIILYAKNVIYSLWFLWAIFYCSLAVVIVGKLFRDSYLAYSVILLLTFITPDIFGFEKYKYMYPYFVLAYLYGNNEYKIKSWIERRARFFSLDITICGLVYLVLFLFYDYDSYIYTSGYTLLRSAFDQQITINLYRFIIGFVGTIWIILVIKLVYGKSYSFIWNPIAMIGKESLGIYIISGYIFSYALLQIVVVGEQVNYVVALVQSIMILILSYFCTLILKKNFTTNVLLLGGRK